MANDSSYVLERLNLKKTPKRQAMMEILAEAPHYTTPEEVWQRMRLRFGKIGLPTVYRNLEELAEGGVVSKILHPDRKLYYFYCPNDGHHHHFICVSCRKVEDLANCLTEGVEKEIERFGGKVLSHIVQVNGLCGTCSKRKDEG
jgi:Fe2+ or Zn2+ uptake regulation protein